MMSTMLLSAALLTVLSPVGVAVSTADLEGAPAVDAPIESVTVYQGRASVRRRAELKLARGGGLIRFPDLPTSVSQIRVESADLRVMRVSRAQRTRSDLDLTALESHIEALEALNRRAKELADRAALPQRELSLLTSLTPDLNTISEGARRGKLGGERGRGGAELTRDTLKMWREFQRMMRTRYRDAQARQLKVQAELDDIARRYEAHWGEASELLQRAQVRQVVEVFAFVHATRDRKATITLSYDVPNASWTPVHELHVDVERAKARRAFGAKIKQMSGEDWRDVKITVSNHVTSHMLSRPKLQTWTLSERQQYLPVVRAERVPQRGPLFSAPQPSVTSAVQDRRAVMLQRIQAIQRESALIKQHSAGLSARLNGQSLGQRGQRALTAGRGGLAHAEHMSGGYGANHHANLGAATRQAPPPQAPPARRSSRRRAPSRPSAAPAPSMSSPMRPSLRPSMSPSMDYESVAEDSAARVSVTSTSARGRVSRGGLSLVDQVTYQAESEAHHYTLIAPNQATIKHGDSAILVPLEVVETPIEIFYEATPALSPHAYLTGEAEHQGEHPILGGSSTLFSSGVFVGESRLNTVQPGDQWSVPLGADPDLRVKRHVAVKTRVEGLISHDEISVYQVEIEVANYKRRPVRAKLYDVLPISDHDEVEVKLLEAKPEANIKDPKRGVVCWDQTLKGGQQLTLTLSYQVKRPKGWRVYQR